MNYILNTDSPNAPATIVKDGFIWRLCIVNGADKGFYVRTFKKVKAK